MEAESWGSGRSPFQAGPVLGSCSPPSLKMDSASGGSRTPMESAPRAVASTSSATLAPKVRKEGKKKADDNSVSSINCAT